MLYITVMSNTPSKGKVREDYEWHVGKPHPIRTENGCAFSLCDVESVQADGDELAYILQNPNIPCKQFTVVTRVVTYFGDDARFIVANCLTRTR